MNIPFTKLPVHGQVCSQVYNSANMTNVESSCNPSAETDKSDIADDGANMTNVQSSCNQSKESGVSNIAAEGAHGSGDSGNQAQFRDMQRRHIEFIKKRFLLLEKGLNAECQKEYFVSALVFHGTQFFLILKFLLFGMHDSSSKC